jgi:hypothetical protein
MKEQKQPAIEYPRYGIQGNEITVQDISIDDGMKFFCPKCVVPSEITGVCKRCGSTKIPRNSSRVMDKTNEDATIDFIHRKLRARERYSTGELEFLNIYQTIRPKRAWTEKFRECLEWAVRQAQGPIPKGYMKPQTTKQIRQKYHGVNSRTLARVLKRESEKLNGLFWKLAHGHYCERNNCGAKIRNTLRLKVT